MKRRRRNFRDAASTPNIKAEQASLGAGKSAPAGDNLLLLADRC
jgi:hypothetical protein